MCGIYKITNTINGKVYIGQSTNIEERWKAHHNKPFNLNSSQYNTHFYRAIRKYGIQSFTFEVIEECSEEEIPEREKYWITYYNAFNPEYGYNATEGGEGALGAEIKLTQTQILEIYDLLLNTSLSQQEIANQYGVSQFYISLLNRGINKPQQGYSYPLRPFYFLQHQQAKPSIYICPLCGNPKTKKAEVCIDCFNQEKSSHIPSREELKALIREKSFVQIGKMFNVSDNAIRKWCDKYSLPRKKSDIKQISDEEWDKI